MFSASNIYYELADRVRGLGPGGIGAMHLEARRTGLIDEIDKRLHLLKIHKPYHESDHVLNIAYNILCSGTCLEDIELRRNDEVYLDALGAQRIPDPMTEGDFCRRFGWTDIQILMNVTNDGICLALAFPTLTPLPRREGYGEGEWFDEARRLIRGSLYCPP